jgi:hypothetical protein
MLLTPLLFKITAQTCFVVPVAQSSKPKAKPKAAAPVEENLYKSTMSLEERVAIAMSVGEEVVTEEELTAMFRGIIHYYYAEVFTWHSSEKQLLHSISQGPSNCV